MLFNKIKGIQNQIIMQVFMVASGMGMFQMVATSAKDEGSACRIHGRIPVRKVSCLAFKLCFCSTFLLLVLESTNRREQAICVLAKCQTVFIMTGTEISVRDLNFSDPDSKRNISVKPSIPNICIYLDIILLSLLPEYHGEYNILRERRKSSS